MSTLFSDLILAERLEHIEAVTAENYVKRLAQRRPGVDVAVEEVAGGRAVFAGPGSPLSESKGIGLHGPVTQADLDRMERIFFSRGEPSRVVVCPLADPSLVEGLNRRGYRISHFENILATPLSSSSIEALFTPGIEVRPAAPSEAHIYAQVVAPNFVEPGEPTAEIMEMAATMFEMEHSASFLALIDGEPVGGGAVIMHEGLALFAGAATLPPFRNRGVHAALHHARLAHALGCGCDLAAQGAAPAAPRSAMPSARAARRIHQGPAHPRARVRSRPARWPIHPVNRVRSRKTRLPLSSF